MVLGGEAFGEGLDHENGALKNGTSEPSHPLPTLSPPREDTAKDSRLQSRKWTAVKHPAGQHLDSGHPAPKTMRDKCCLSCRALGLLRQHRKLTQKDT